LHPQDLALLQQRLGGDDALHAEQAVQLRPDPGLARGDCRVQAGDLGVGSSLHARLAEARDRILEGIPSEARP
jgi:flagellar biosynthesis/type III secretory pathway protein FliH